MLIASLALAALLSGIDLPWIDWKACPGEYCCYGRWRAVRDVAVWPTYETGKTPLLTVKRGTVVTTKRGIIVTRTPGLIELLKPMTFKDAVIPAGAVINSLYYAGEGFEVFEYDGKIRSAFIGINRPGVYPRSDPQVRVLTVPDEQWWVELETEDGRVGWAIQNGTFALLCEKEH